MPRNLVLIAMFCVLGSAVVQAKECKGVSFPDQLQVGDSTLNLNGLGVRMATILKVKVYVAALYLPHTSTDANAILGANGPAELILQFVRDVGNEDIAKAWSEGFANNAKEQLPALQDRIAMLNGWMADIKSGEQMRFAFKPRAGVEVMVNGKVKGTIEGDDFARAFLSIWLGAKPPNPEIKAGLLGGACG